MIGWAPAPLTHAAAFNLAPKPEAEAAALAHRRLAAGGCLTCLMGSSSHDGLDDCFGRWSWWDRDQYCPCRGYTGPASWCPVCREHLT